MSLNQAERLERERRWRLALGEDADASQGGGQLNPEDLAMDKALTSLYSDDRKANLSPSSPKVARWLGDIRTYFPTPVVRILQQDALERLNLKALLLEKEMLDSVEVDIHLVATLVSLSRLIPEKTKATARQVVQKLVDQLMERLAEPMRAAVRGALDRAVRNHRPRLQEIDWPRTIRANLRHYQPSLKTIIPERLVGFGRRNRRCQRHVILCIDQSGSMAESVVYSSIFGAVLASLPAVTTSLVVFDTAVVDMTPNLHDPVDLLFGVQLGGGTDINRAVAYCQELVREPSKTVFILISDLIEGGVARELLQRSAQMVASGITYIALLALSDEGRPVYDAHLASQMAQVGVPSFACTPDLFPDLMAAAIRKEDIQLWAAKHERITSRGSSLD